MATKFLDYTGLSHLCSKFKEWCNSIFVTKATNENITGTKIFSSFLYTKNTEAVKGTLPSESKFIGVAFIDSSNNPSTANANELNSRLGFIEHATYTSGTSESRIGAYKFTTDLDHQIDQAILAVGYTNTGIKYAYAPSTPEDYLRGDAIITYNWLPKDTRIVHTTGNESISGIKTFSDDIVINQSTLKAIVKDTDSDTTRTDTIIKANSANSDYGINALFGSGSNCIVGAGEGKDSQLNELAGQSTENVYIVADGGIYLKPNANTFANAKDIWFNPSGGVTFTIHNITRGTAPSSTFEVMPIEVRDSVSNRLGILSVLYNTDKSSLSALYAYNTTAATGANIGRLGIGCDSSGSVYTVAPTPSASDNSTKIATTAFVNTKCGNYLPLTGGTVNGWIAATGFSAKHASIVKGTNPSSWTCVDIDIRDNSSNGGDAAILGKLRTYVTAEGNVGTQIWASKYDTDATAAAVLEVRYLKNGTKYAIAPSTPDNVSDETAILTYNWIPKDTRIVHTIGNETVAGRKTFTSNVFINNDTPSLYHKFTNVTRGTLLSSNKFFPLVATLDKDEKYLFEIQAGLYNHGGSTLSLITYKQDSTTDYSYFTLNNDNGAHGLNTNISFHNMHTNAFQQTMNSGNTYFNLFAGGNSYDGACFTLLGRTHVYNPGWFILSASNKLNASSEGNKTSLMGLPNGTLQWNGQSIQTSSDRRLKTPISEVSDDVLDVWENVFWGEFKFLSSVKEKGDDARSHIGLIAQDVDEVCTANNVDICHYGILCHDTHLNGPDEPAQDLWMIRYTEALCMEAAYQRRKNKILENRISELEKRLAKLEGAV